jgi:hypothetical protein
MKPKTVFYLALILGVLILGQAIYEAIHTSSAKNSFSITWNLVVSALLFKTAYNNYQAMKA